MRPEAKLLVGGEDDDLFLTRQRRLRVEAQQRIQDRKRAFRYAEPWPGRADRAKDFPLVDRLVRWPLRGGYLGRKMVKRQRSPPEGVVG